MSSWAHTGHYETTERAANLPAVVDVADGQVVDLLRQHRADAARSPEALRTAALGTRGPKSKAWRVLS